MTNPTIEPARADLTGTPSAEELAAAREMLASLVGRGRHGDAASASVHYTLGMVDSNLESAADAVTEAERAKHIRRARAALRAHDELREDRLAALRVKTDGGQR